MNLKKKVTIMRLFLVSLLLLTVAGPALAADPLEPVRDDPVEQREAREPRFDPSPRPERQFREAAEAPRARPERAERSEPLQRVERPEPLQRAERAEPVQRFEPGLAAPEPVAAAAAPTNAEPRRERWNRAAASTGGGGRREVQGGPARWREGMGERRIRNREVPPSASSPVFGSAIPGPETIALPRREVSTGSAAVPVPPSGDVLRQRIAGEGLRRQRIESEQWRRDWRQDRRYDWRRYRDRDRARFHLGIYIDPFGWNYRDLDIGWRLPSRYYASRYWIYDPWNYRLPPVSGPYRWIRYHNDVLLVDLRSGRVLDRIRHFFW